MTDAPPSRFRLVRLEGQRDARAQLVDDVRDGLLREEKSLPPRHFYDARGSELFVEITRLPEYYPTRTETAILRRVADELVGAVRPEEITELGSGASEKTRLLLTAMHAAGSGRRYVAFDVSEAAIEAAAAALTRDHDWLEVLGVVGDFGAHLAEIPRGGRRIVALLGSTIGNMPEAERAVFLRPVRAMLADDDRFLCGFDLVKEAATLEAAYDDAAGVTAAFNLNLLHVLNRELDGDLPIDAFEHVARWNATEERIEISLRALRPVEASLPGADVRVRFEEGEEMLTEVSCKFTQQRAEAELGAAGFRVERWDTDERAWFGVALCAPA